jgi:hypothetical protein
MIFFKFVLQLGMPLQGISLRSKVEVLKAVADEEISLKEMSEKASSIKAKRSIVDAFLKFTGEENWEDLKREFPIHTTESKISQFKHLKVKAN